MPVPIEEAKRFGILITDDNRQITEFEEKPENPRSNLSVRTMAKAAAALGKRLEIRLV